MPKIKIGRYENGPVRGSGKNTRCGLRGRQSTVEEDPVPLTQREKDDCFDMYSIVEKRRPNQNGRKGAKRENIQFWHIASIIAALGAFCIFMDSIFITSMGVTLKLASFEILMSPSDAAESLPSCATYMSAVPLVFLAVFVMFAFMKEDAFDKASLVLMAIPVFIIAALIYWGDQIGRHGSGYLYDVSPGYAFLAEIGCAVALIIVVACQRVMGRISQNKTPFSRK